jgi:hypothetical protein
LHTTGSFLESWILFGISIDESIQEVGEGVEGQVWFCSEGLVLKKLKTKRSAKMVQQPKPSLSLPRTAGETTRAAKAKERARASQKLRSLLPFKTSKAR